MGNEKVLVMMIGLPCTGKSYLVKRLSEFLNSKGVNCQDFNIGKRRRES